MLPQNAVVLMCFVVLMVFAADDETTTNHTVGPVVSSTTSSSTANGSISQPSGHQNNVLKSLAVDPSMIRRALYVLIGITGVGVLYFLVRAVRMKKPAYKKQYGLLANMELDGESDEDETLYEARR